MINIVYWWSHSVQLMWVYSSWIFWLVCKDIPNSEVDHRSILSASKCWILSPHRWQMTVVGMLLILLRGFAGKKIPLQCIPGTFRRLLLVVRPTQKEYILYHFPYIQHQLLTLRSQNAASTYYYVWDFWYYLFHDDMRHISTDVRKLLYPPTSIKLNSNDLKSVQLLCLVPVL